MSYLDALQATLAAEHAAVYVYGYLGAQTSASAQPTFFAALEEAYEVHRERRDGLESLIREEGGDPVAAEAAYEVADVTGDPAAAGRAAVALEDGCAQTYRFLVASSSGAQRRVAVDLLVDSAVRRVVLGGGPERFPGA